MEEKSFITFGTELVSINGGKDLLHYGGLTDRFDPDRDQCYKHFSL
jgi:hypothetical protein